MNCTADQPELKHAQRTEGPERSSAGRASEAHRWGIEPAWPGSPAANAWQTAEGHH